MTSDNGITMAEGFDRDAVEPAVREGVVVLGMVVLTLLGMLLPGTGRELPGTEVAVGDVVIGVGTLGIVASLLYAAPKLRHLVATSLQGPSAIVYDTASIVQYLVVFVAVLIAHQGFAPVLRAVLGVAWVYDLGFLLFALAPLGAIAYRFTRALDPLAQFLTAEVLGWGAVRRADVGAGEEDCG